MALRRTDICLYESIRRLHASLRMIDRGSSLSAEDDGTKYIIIYTKKVYNRGWKVWSSLEVLGGDRGGVGWLGPDPIARWNICNPKILFPIRNIITYKVIVVWKDRWKASAKII